MEFESTRMYVHTQSLLAYANFEKDTEKKREADRHNLSKLFAGFEAY